MSCDQVQIKYTGDGTAVLFTFPFEYEKQSDVKVGFLNEDNGRYEEVAMTDANHPWSFENATTIRFTTAPTEEFKIYRNTTTQFAVFAPGSSIRAQDLNKNFDEIDMLVEEAKCGTSNALDYVDENFWNKKGDTLKGGEDWVGTDTKIATNLRNDERYLKLAGPGANITVEQEQLDGTVPNDDAHVLSNAASIERYDSILSTSDPGPQSQPGKIWQNTADETQNYWNDSIEAWVDNHKVGPIGPEGPQGPSGTVTVGTTATSAPGSDAQVTNTGTPEAAILNFTIPRGEEGPPGPDGPQGPAGAGVTFQGNIDATQPNSAPADPEVGDLYANTGNGFLDASWGLGTDTIEIFIGWTIAWGANGSWNVLEPSLAADLWELNSENQVQPLTNRDVYVARQQSFGGTPANPALTFTTDPGVNPNVGLSVPTTGTLGIHADGATRAIVNSDGITVGPSIELQGTNETIIVGNMRIDSNQINHVGQWTIDINNRDLMVFRDQDITTIEDLDVEGTAAPGSALSTTTGNVYRIDAVTAGDEAWWESVGAPNPQVGAYFTAQTDGPVPANNSITWILNTADLHVSGDTSIGGGLTVNNITFPDGSQIITGGGGGAAVNISPTPPANPQEGDMWWNSNDGRLYIWYIDPDTDAQWVDASPENAQLIAVLNDLGDVNTESVPAVDGQGLIWSEAEQMWVRSTASVVPEELPAGVTVTIDDPGGVDRFTSKTFGVDLGIVNPGFPLPTASIRTSVTGNIVFQGRSDAPTNRAGTTRNAQVGDFTDQGGYYFGRYGGRFMIVAPVLQDPDNWNTSTTLQGGFGQTPSLWGRFGRYPQNANWHDNKGGGADSGNYEYGYNATYGNRNNTAMGIFYWCTTDPNGPNAGAMQASPGGDGTGTGINGYNDWYLPARNELIYLYRQLKPTTEQNRVSDNDATIALPNADPPLPVWTANDPTMTTVAIFQGQGQFNQSHTNAAHWSTTQRDSEKARRISFGSGWDDNRDNKDQGCTGRAIRSTTTQPITSLEVFTFADAGAIADFTVGMNISQENSGARGVVTDITDNTMTVMTSSGTFNDTDILLGPSQTFNNTQFFLTSTDDGDGNVTVSAPSQADPGFVAWNGAEDRFGGTGTIVFPADFDGTPVDSMFTTGTRLDVELRLTNTSGDVDTTGTVTPISNFRQAVNSTISTLTAQVKALTDYILRVENRDRAPGTEVVYLNQVYTWDGEKWIQDSSLNDNTAYELPLEVLE